MGLTVRYYLFLPDRIEHMPRRLMDGLAWGKDAMPQHANSRQRFVEIVLDNEDGVPKRILSATGRFLTFDGNGKVERQMRADVGLLLRMSDEISRDGNVVDLSEQLSRQRWERENTWELSTPELNQLTADVFKTAPKRIKQAKGIAEIPPPLNYEAKTALSEISMAVFKIDCQIQDLSEAALKSLAYQAGKEGEQMHIQPVWQGVAASVERRLAVLKRRRSTKGIWFAVIDSTTWHKDHTGEGKTLAVEKCNSLETAEEAARRLLIENAHHVRHNVSVEPSIYTDLEWDEEAECRID